MFRDLGQSTRHTLVPCDIAIIGAGAAGITLALELEKSGLSVTVLEGGYRQWSKLSQNRYQGTPTTSSGFEYPDLDLWRLRYFGGTTNHWTGWCRRLEENVFTQRSTGLGDGWPFARPDLEADYVRALEVCTLGRDVFHPSTLLSEGAMTDVIAPTEILSTLAWRFPEQFHFGAFYGPRLRESNSIFYFGANCVGFTCENQKEGLSSISHVATMHVKNDAGDDFQLSARCFVLASGGIENVRQLLWAQKNGLQELNRSGVLGHGFMEHPHGLVGAALLGDHDVQSLSSWLDFPLDTDGTQFKLGLGLQDEVLIDHGLANISFTMVATETISAQAIHSQAVRTLWDTTRKKSDSFIGLYTRAEQRWNSESRIKLMPQLDDLGSPLAGLDWRVHSRDIADIGTSLGLVATELMKMGFGPVTIGDPLERGVLTGGGHQLGGARMHESADEGVVDVSMKCHGVNNLYVVGGAVFPTSGSSNPTLTIVAMAVRLARTLQERLQ